MNPIIISAFLSAGIGALVGVGVSLINNRVTTAKHETRLDEHDRRFSGVDVRFASMDSDFVPRKEMDSRLFALASGQDRIEKVLNLVLAVWQGKTSS